MLNPLCHYSPLIDFNFYQLVRYFQGWLLPALEVCNRCKILIENKKLLQRIEYADFLQSSFWRRASGRRRSQCSPHHKLATSQSVIYLISAHSVLYNKGNKINKKLKSVVGTCKTRPIYALFAVSSDTNMEGATVHSCSTLISLCTATVMSLRSFQSVRYIRITRCLCSL